MIPVLQPDIRKEDISVVQKSLEEGWVSWHGPYYELFSESLENFLGLKKLKKRVVLTSSGSTALHVAYLLAKRKGPSFFRIPELTYVATLSALKQVAKDKDIIIDDVKLDDWNIFCRPLPQKNEVVTYVDLYGFPSEMYKNGITIEDSCESLGAVDQRGNASGTKGDYGVFSFFANKIITTGEGGALVVPSSEYEYAKNIVNHFPGGVGYDHPDFGYNYRMSHMSAALGYSQMNRIKENLAAKHRIFKFYWSNIKKNIQFQISSGTPSYWVTTVLFENENLRSRIEGDFNKNEIGYRRIFKPMSQLIKRGPAPKNAIDIYNRGLSLPSSVNIGEKDLDFICKVINNV